MQASKSRGLLCLIRRTRADNVNLQCWLWAKAVKRALFSVAAVCVMGQKRMPDGGLRPEMSTDGSPWRDFIHMSYAGVPKTGRGVQF